MVSVRVQPGAGYRREPAVATVRTIRRGTVGEGDPRSADQQVQGLRLRHDDQLRRSVGRHTVAERLHAGQSGPAGVVQDQQVQVLSELDRKLDTIQTRAFPNTDTDTDTIPQHSRNICRLLNLIATWHFALIY